jgi:hypothetical protein
MLAVNAADRASELQASIAQPKRMSAGQSPASSVGMKPHALLGGVYQGRFMQMNGHNSHKHVSRQNNHVLSVAQVLVAH